VAAVREALGRRIMTKRLCVGLTLLATTVVAASVVGNRPTRTLGPNRAAESAPGSRSDFTEASPIEALDRCIQRRLHEHQGFGMARLADSLIQLNKFEPESTAEAESLEGLRAFGWTVGLRLGSRSLLASASDGQDDDHDMSQPIVITTGTMPGEPPGPGELRELARKALGEADTADSTRGSVGRWSVEARVVRADRQACLKCHTREGATAFPAGEEPARARLKIGDAVGVAIYSYARDVP
jgi:hypothetical protein